VQVWHYTYTLIFRYTQSSSSDDL